MADKKISQLPAATTPLAGTEVLPIVQSGTTDQVSIANITAGRVPAMNNAAMGYTAVTAAAGTTTLTATSNHIQRLTGSAAQTYKLPDATTMFAGTAFLFDNDSTGLLTVVDNASGAVTTVPSNSIQYVYLMTNATAAGTWGKYSWTYGGGALSITAAKSASITNSLTLSGTDSTTMTFPATSATIARTDAAQTFSGTQTIDVASGSALYLQRGAGVNGFCYVDFASAYTNWYSKDRYNLTAGGSGGVYLAAGGTSWTAVSDERFKTNLQPIENAAEKVSTLRAVTGRYETDAENVSRAFLIAQDVQAVLPEAVDALNPDQIGLSYSDVIPLLVAAIKELKTEIDALKGAK